MTTDRQPTKKNAGGERMKSFAKRYLLLMFLVLNLPFLGCGASKTVPTGTTTLTWTAPTTNEDGSPLTDLAGYRVYYGTAPGAYTAVDVGNVISYDMSGLTKGQTYYFAITAYNSSGIESAFSNIVSKLID